MQKVKAADMRMLMLMCKSRKNRISDERIWEHLGMTSIVDKLRGTLLRWFGHIQCELTIAI